MCNGSSQRTSRGGAVVVVHSSRADTSEIEGCQIHLRNAIDDTESMTVVGVERFSSVAHHTCHDMQMLIHEYGDLRLAVKNPALHSFPISDLDPVSLKERLDLGVGGKGIIGRTASILVRGEVIGEGIVGWN